MLGTDLRALCMLGMYIHIVYITNMAHVYNGNTFCHPQKKMALIMVKKVTIFPSIFYIIQYPTVLVISPQIKEAEEITFTRDVLRSLVIS